MAEIMKVGINCGSGQRRFHDEGDWKWLNMDCVSRPDQVPDIVCDARERWPVEDASVDMVMLSHCLEHWNLHDQDKVLAECHRVLKHGGSIVIIVPNLRALAQRWLARQITDWIYIINLCGADQGEPGDIHRWHVTPESLREKLAKWQWSKIQDFDWRKIPGTDICPAWWYFGTEIWK